jgi:DNA-binding FadR family transcriptional regulator
VALPEELADMLLESIVDGQFPIESVLPSEGELALKYGMSRLTVREAVRILRSQNIVDHPSRSRHLHQPAAGLDVAGCRRPHRGTPVALGGSIGTPDRSEADGRDRRSTVGCRQPVEGGSRILAASIEEMRLANRLNRVELFVEADIAFHDVVMRATANMFIPFMFEPFGNLLVEARTETSSVPEIQVNAIAMHEAILEALTAGDPRRSRDAMEAHMESNRSRSAPIRPRRRPALTRGVTPPGETT